jgi:hypothetical protein
MVSPEERISRVEGVLEQVNERLGNLERPGSGIIAILEQKADKSEVRLHFVTSTTVLVAVIGLLGAVLARI